MNEVELLMPGELCLHLPTNILGVLESLEKNIPTLINASDEQGRRMLIECVRTEDLVTIKVINGDDLMSSVMIKDERNDEDNDSAFVLSVVSDCSKPAEDPGLLPSDEELLVEETVFADDCKATACSTGGRLKPYSKCENFIRRHLVSWQNHRYEPIECLVCRSQMHLSESYYLHIRRHHRSDPQYRAAMKHLIQVREMRLRRKCRMSIRCIKCDDMLTEYTIISHLRVVHSTDPCLNQMITTTKLCIKNMMRSQSLANQKVKICCQFCEKEMRNSTLKSHLEFHCPALVAVIPNVEIRQEVLESAAKNGADAVLVRMPRTTTCNQCNKTMTLKAFYHHQRRVHGIGINGAKTYSCSYCKKTFWDQFHLQNHLLIHTRDRAFVCLVCCRSFINMVSYSEHHRKVHERQFLHCCSVCGRGFWKRVEKIRHNCKPQDLSINQLKNARLAAKARVVMDRWEGPFYLEMDRSEAHKFTSNAANLSHRLKQNTLQDKKKLVCTVCKKSFQSIRYFQSHLRYSHLQDYDLICENCGLGFWNVRQMTSHKCDSSKRSYNTKKRILLATKAKEKLKDIPKPYYCVIGVSDPLVNYPSLVRTDLECSKTPCQTADEDGKEETINCHGNILGFRKDSKIADAENLEHKNLERSSVKKTSWLTRVQADCTLCSICGKEIKLKNYYPHMRRVHCDDSHKPIAWKVCEQCGYRCQDNYKFRRHCLTHNKKAAVIPCELCGRLSYELVDYNHHFKHRHLGQFNIRCELCGKGFWKINALQNHICYPELREENLRLQQLKAESAVKKRDAIRRATGINSNIGICGRKKNLHQKILEKKNCSEPEKKKCRNNRQKSSTYRNAKNKVLKKENDRISGQQSMCADLQRQTGCHDNDTSLITTVSGHSAISERSLNDLGETTDEIQRHSHFKGNCSVENFNKPADFESKIVRLSTLINLGTKTKAGKKTIGLKGSAEEKISRNQKLCEQDLVVSVHSHTENVHQYETRKRQVSFRALIGKK